MHAQNRLLNKQSKTAFGIQLRVSELFRRRSDFQLNRESAELGLFDAKLSLMRQALDKRNRRVSFQHKHDGSLIFSFVRDALLNFI